MDDKGCIYLIRNLVNWKPYVGQSKYPDPQVRWKVHLKCAKKGSKYFIHRAIRKYGENNFKIELIGLFRHSALGEMEAYYAEQYGSYRWDPRPGYNMVWCAQNFRLGITHTKETRKKLSEVNTGRKQSPESIAKRVLALTGQKHSQEACDNISRAKRAKGISEEGRQKLSERHIGKKMSLEARENMKKGHAARKKENPSSETSIVSSRPKMEYKCDQCDKIFHKNGALKLHMRTHTGEKPYVCDTCGKGFACGSNLDEHMFKHKPKCCNCDSCDKLFASPRSLQNHKKKFHSISF